MVAMPKHFSAIVGMEVAARYFNDGQEGRNTARMSANA
jgi:hypothetical protein